MTLEARPLSPAIGALINGIDLNAPLADSTKAKLRDAFYDIA